MSRAALVFTALAACAVLSCSVVSARAPLNANDAALTQLLELVNQKRAASGLHPLHAGPELMAAGAIRARELAGHFSHSRPDGSSCFTLFPAGYHLAAENIAFGTGKLGEPQAVFLSWEQSPGHLANMVKPEFTHAGLGRFEKNGAVYWALLFARKN